MEPLLTTTTADEPSLGTSMPEQVPEQSPDPACKPNEFVLNDITLQLKNKESVYKIKQWVDSKLYKIKTDSTLSSETTVTSNTININANILSFNILSGDKTALMELHFFEGGIIKFNCVNPANPSKFSFELIDKPANLTPYPLQNKVAIESDRVEVTVPETHTKVIVRYNPYTVSLVSTVSGSESTLLEMNSNKSLQFDDNISADFSFHTEYLYGLPERACNMQLEDTKAELPYRFYNQDLPKYPIGSKDNLYATVPIIISRSKNSPTLVSMYWQNTSDTYIEVHKTAPTTQAYWMSERGNLECYVIVSHTNQAHFKAFSDIFGHCAMPQYFSLGYHQCRWSYKDQKDVLQVNKNFNDHEIPCDTITLDIDHTDGCRYFTWNEKLFPDPVAMQQVLVENGRQLVTIADPHIKVDEKYHVYKEVMEKGLHVLDKDGKPFIGWCWSGNSLYMDFLNEETRACWGSQYGFDKYKKSTPNVWAWNDMNEPSVFELPGNHMPADNIQTFKTIAEPEKAFQVEHREVHNIYGYCHHKATYDGMIKRNESQNVRPHVLSRSFFAGSQKWTTIWTGDTAATWDYLKITVPQMLSLSLCGISNVGGDVGGFMGNPEPELAVRWYQLGAFMPYFRAHSETTTKRREPWLFEKKYMEIIKETIKDRYRLLPYWYTSFEEHCRTAVPLLRPVWFDQEGVLEESSMYDQERFMIGDGILVVPILEEGKLTITDPIKGLEGRWYDYFTKKEVVENGDIKTGLERIGCFVKGGKIIPTYELASYVKSSQDARKSNIHLYVALDEEDNAQGKLYFDDGETFDYKRGVCTRKTVEFKKNVISWESEGSEGFGVQNRVTKVTIMGASKKFENAFLVEEGKQNQKIRLEKRGDNILLEFVTLASKNWKIVLE